MEQERSFKGVWVPKEIWLNKDLTLQQKVMLVEIDSLENEEKGCFATNKYFADFFDLSPSRISHIIAELVDKGYLTISFVKEGNEIKERQIRLNKPPYPQVLQKCNTGIANTQGGYCENNQDNNINTNNINIYKYIVDYLNEKTNSKYKHTTPKTKSLINARLKEGFKVEDFEKVIDTKVNDWLEDSKMKNYLRPETLFGTKFEGYLNQSDSVSKKENHRRSF